LNNYNSILEEINTNKSSLKVFSGLENNDLGLITQTALYIDQFIIYDPLFKFTEKESEISRITSNYLGYENKKLDKNELASTTKLMKLLTPMVAADYIKIIPASYHLEPPSELSINYPLDNYKSILPQSILNYFHTNASVKSMERNSSGWVINERLEPCRGIYIEFNGLNSRQGFVYHLFEIEIDKLDKESGLLSYHQKLPDYPPDSEQFKTWVFQSINSASKAVFDKIYLDNIISSEINTTYLCNNAFTANLLISGFDAKQNIQTQTFSDFINLELPFLKRIKIDKLMEIRKYEDDVFTNFRLELERQFREIRLVKDRKEIEIRKENILHELNDVQVRKINAKFRSINRKKLFDAVLMIGGLAGSFQTGGLSLLASALALGKGYKDVCDYYDEVKENPSYLLWKVQK
jgi:hypothetical protein